jgi:hypothetical protein
MTFFYDLNKRLANLSQQQTLTEGAVAEASYSAKAARAGKDIGKPGKNFEKIAKGAAERYGSKAAGERVAGAVLNKLRHPSEGMAEGQLNELSPELLKRARDKAGMKYAQADDRRDQKASDKYNAQDDKFNSALRKKQKGMAEADMDEGNEFSGELVKAKANHQNSFKVDGRTYPVKEEGGMPMTAKQKSFAALAPPKDKITFADKIAGAKQEVEEMLGDVAAEAMRSALGGKKQMADEGAGQFYVYHKTKGDRAGGADYDLLKTFPDKGSAMAFAQTYNNKISADKKNFHSAVVRTKSVKKDMDEGFDDMERDVKRRLSTPKVGDVRRGARHDIETTATGVRATRRHDDETDDQPTGEKRRAGRPKGADKGPERVTGKAYKHKGGRVKEDGIMPGATDADAGEYGYEGDMAKDQIHTIVRHAKDLEKILSNREDLPEWVQSKLAKIEGMMAAVDDYMQTQHERGSEMSQGIDMEEESTNKRDNRAEKAGRRVTKDIEYDEKKKDGIHGKRRGSEDDRAEKAGRKVAKDIEYDEKKKEKKVAETTTSGSVATGGAAPKSTKGGVQIGKGIYDSLNRKLENMIAESMSINVSMTNDDNGSHKNITVTASDEDAEALAQLLRSAGLGGDMSHGHDHGHEEPCPACGSTDCGCDESVAEAYGDTDATQNKPNWPTNTEYSDDAMQYSGGLNKPKTDVAGDGQSTVPVTAVHTQEEDELRRLREMAGIKQQELMPWERTMKESGGMDDDYDADYQGYAGEEPDAEIVTTPQGNKFEWHYSDGETDATFVYPGGKITVAYDNTARAFDTDNMQTDDKVARYVFSSYGKNLPKDEVEIGKLIDKIIDMKKRGMTEGVADKVKGAVKKGLEKLGHGSDKDMIKDLQKKTGVPATGEKPADKKMEESLMQEFANFRI